jgi:hypothetical protein
MKDRLHAGLQLQRHHRLRNPVSHGRHSQDSRPTAMRLRNLHRPHLRRKVRPRRHPIPDLVQIVVPIRIEVVDGAPVRSRRTLVRLNALICLPHQTLRNVKRLVRLTRLAHSSPPTRTSVPWLLKYTNLTMSRPLRSTPITGASPLLRAGPPARPHRYSVPPVSAVGNLPIAHPRPPGRAHAVSALAFPRSVREPQTGLTPPPCRTPPGQ